MNSNQTPSNSTLLPDRNDTQSSTRINENQSQSDTPQSDTPQSGLWCPNCGQALQAQKCKLFCRTAGCGYLVTCSEW